MIEKETTTIDVVVNGKPVSIPVMSTVLGYLTLRGHHERLVVVEINGEILPKNLFSNTELKSGDIVEIVHFVGGGR